MGEILCAQSIYALTQKQFVDAHKKLNNKYQSQTLTIGLLSIILSAIFIVMHFYFKSFDPDYAKDNSILIIGALLLALGFLYCCIFIGAVRTTARRTKVFFEEYNVGDQLIYDVSFSEIEVVIKTKDNVTHMSKKRIENVVDLGNCVAVLFSLGTALIIPKTAECEQLIQAFSSLFPEGKKGGKKLI